MSKAKRPSRENMSRMRGQYPGTLLIFRVTDRRYAAFGEDAGIIHRLCGREQQLTSVTHSVPDLDDWIEIPVDQIGPVLAAIDDDGRRAVVYERTEEQQCR